METIIESGQRITENWQDKWGVNKSIQSITEIFFSYHLSALLPYNWM